MRDCRSGFETIFYVTLQYAFDCLGQPVGDWNLLVNQPAPPNTTVCNLKSIGSQSFHKIGAFDFLAFQFLLQAKAKAAASVFFLVVN